MSKGHRTQIKRVRNKENVDKRPSARLSNARVSSRKASFVLDAIRGKDVGVALGIVTYSPRYASRLIKKLIESAVANAKNNNQMDEEKLYVAECFAGNATNYKRMHPRAQGRAYSILKRNSHITVIL
ncbi:MAG: 50S ribosomal protein L22, partial [Lachnospiraceae bacterium]|nr:50S ribosomal protein L22 [Lachnospiraceae bacterium]